MIPTISDTDARVFIQDAQIPPGSVFAPAFWVHGWADPARATAAKVEYLFSRCAGITQSGVEPGAEDDCFRADIMDILDDPNISAAAKSQATQAANEMDRMRDAWRSGSVSDALRALRNAVSKLEQAANQGAITNDLQRAMTEWGLLITYEMIERAKLVLLADNAIVVAAEAELAAAYAHLANGDYDAALNSARDAVILFSPNSIIYETNTCSGGKHSMTRMSAMPSHCTKPQPPFTRPIPA